MKFTYNAEGTRKKELVNAVSHLLETDSVYQGPPSFAYKVDGYTIDRHGNLIAPDEATTDDLFRLTDALFAEYGFKPKEDLAELFSEADEEDDEAVCEPDPDEEDVTVESELEDEVEDSPEEPEAEASTMQEPAAPEAPENGPETAAFTVTEDNTEEAGSAPENGDDTAPDEGEETAEASDTAEAPEAAEATEEPPESEEDDTDADDADKDTKLTLSLPREKFSDAAIDRLRALVQSKQTLLKKVFETEELTIIVNDGQIMFPWFTLHNIDGEVDAYAKFIHAIALRALTSSRISSTEKPTDNDKFTMRLFLNNLGFKGEEYKFARRFLIRNLEGNGAWRYGNAPSATDCDLDMPTVFKSTVIPPAQDELTEEEAEGTPDDESEEEVGNEEEESTDEK